MKRTWTAKDTFISGLILVLCCLALRPYWTNGLWGDDLVNSNIWGTAYLAGVGVGEMILRSWKFWLLEKGRVFPLSSAITDFSLYMVRDAAWIRRGQVGLALVHFGLWALWIRRYVGDRRLAWITLLSLPLFLQMRYYHDGLASFFPLLQVVGIELCLALLGLLTFLRGGSRWALVGSVAAFEASLLTYEISYALLPLVWLLIASEKTGSARDKRRIFAPFLVASVLTFVVWAAMKHNAPSPYVATQFRLNLGRILMTGMRQASGNVPLLHEIMFVSQGATFPQLLGRAVSSLPSVLFLLGYGAAFFFLLGVRRENLKIPRSALLIFAFVWMVPSLITGLSGLRQGEVGWGRPYLPDYLTAGGCAALLGVALHREWSVRARAGWAIVLTLILGMQREANYAVAAATDEKFWNDRAVLTELLRSGVLRNLPAEEMPPFAPLRLDPVPTGVNDAYFPVHCGCTVRLVTDSSPAYELIYRREGRRLVSAELIDEQGQVIKKIQ